MKLSRFGKAFTGDSAIVSLMDDLGTALRVNPDLLFMGGGNPARIPQAEAAFQELIGKITNDADMLHQMLGVYQPPQGDSNLLADIADFLRRQLQWPVTANNIAITNGSQSAFFVLFNLFAGEFDDGSAKKVQLPLVPEYTGYADVGLAKDFFVANRPLIETIDKLTFKYHVDFNSLTVNDSVGLMCASRPTNPTGNVLTDSEVQQLDQLASSLDIPFVIDCAYGTPFPDIVFTEAQAYWSENTILVLSLSKLGLPGARTGIVVAREDIIEAVAKANTILSLASGNLGPALLQKLLRDNRIVDLSRNVIQPFYRDAAQQATAWVKEYFADLPCAMHSTEGAFFLWLWFDGIPISSHTLYERLKQRGVLVLAGEHFFIGLDVDWPHQYECIRVTYCQSPEVIRQGLQIIADEVRAAFAA